MSEEKPTFKVTDRRLFNADGSPRDIERDPAPPQTAPTDNIINAAAPTGAASEARSERGASDNAGARPMVAAETASPASVTNPLFLELMMFVAENSAAMMSGHPQFGGEINLPVAKQFIDMLGALREKTTGNLSTEEQTGFDSLLTQLRMQYVQLSGAQTTAAPRGFTGSDITGGK